jgi:hypothetical protein
MWDGRAHIWTGWRRVLTVLLEERPDDLRAEWELVVSRRGLERRIRSGIAALARNHRPTQARLDALLAE